MFPLDTMVTHISEVNARVLVYTFVPSVTVINESILRVVTGVNGGGVKLEEGSGLVPV